MWFQFQMSTIEIYDSNQEEAIQQDTDETTDTDQEEIQHIEINDTTGENSPDTKAIDDESTRISATQKDFTKRTDISVYARPKQIGHNPGIELLSLNI